MMLKMEANSSGPLTLTSFQQSLRANESIDLQSESGIIRSSSGLYSPIIEASAVSMSLETVEANWVSLDSTNGQIQVVNMTGSDIRMRSFESGYILASLCNVGDSLEVEAASGMIDVQVALKGGTPKDLTQISKSKESYVQVASGLGSIYLTYLEHPEDIILTSTAGTFFGSVEIKHRTFEGNFSMETLDGKSTVDGDIKRVRVTERGQLGQTGSFLRGEVTGEENLGGMKLERRSFSAYTETGRIKMSFG